MCVCVRGSLVQSCVTNHTPFNTFALFNSSHHRANQPAANSTTRSLNVCLLSTDKHSKYHKSNITKKKKTQKKNYFFMLTLKPIQQAQQCSWFDRRSSDSLSQPLPCFHYPWDWYTHHINPHASGKHTYICLRWFPVILLFDNTSFENLQICLPGHMMCQENHIKLLEGAVDWGNSVPEFHYRQKPAIFNL